MLLNSYFKLTKYFRNSFALETLRRAHDLNLYWWKEDNNFGDELNPLLLQRVVNRSAESSFDFSKPNLLCIGSILNYANGNSVVWGSGLIKSHRLFKVQPAVICSVRGHLTRKVLSNVGIEVKAVGDLGLIVPDWFKVDSFKIERRYRIGIVPHYADKVSDFCKKASLIDDVLVIDIQSGVENVIKSILSCDVIFSTSLHGIIIADAYGVEAHWLRISNDIVGGNFKFHDYFSSVNRELGSPIIMGSQCDVSELLRRRRNYKLLIDKEQIYESSPFA